MIKDLLEELVYAFESKGHHVRDGLVPGLSRDEITATCENVDLCEDLYQLYTWRNGSSGGIDLDGMIFRDTGFISLSEGVAEADSLVPLYVHPDGLNRTDDIVSHRGSENWICFSAFNGMIYLVVCGEHDFHKDLEHPIVLMGCGCFYAAYDSIESMLRTCIDWTNHESWRLYTTMDENVEMSIWKKNNPITFAMD